MCIRDRLKEQLMSVLSTLTPREEMVLKLRFGLELSLIHI